MRVFGPALLMLPCLFFSLPAQARQEKLDAAISLAVAAEYDEALRMFEEELRRDPDDPLVNYYVAMSHYKLEEISSALAYFEKAIECDAGFPQVFFWSTKAYLLQGMRDEAFETLQRGLKEFPSNKDLRDLAASVRELARDEKSEGPF